MRDLDDDKLRVLRRVLLAAAWKLGLKDEDAEDAAQETLIKYAQGKSLHQKASHSVIDWIRSELGRPGSKRAKYFEALDYLDGPGFEEAEIEEQ